MTRSTGWYSPEALIKLPEYARKLSGAEPAGITDLGLFSETITAGIERAEREANAAEPSTDTAVIDTVDMPVPHPVAAGASNPSPAAARPARGVTWDQLV